MEINNDKIKKLLERMQTMTAFDDAVTEALEKYTKITASPEFTEQEISDIKYLTMFGIYLDLCEELGLNPDALILRFGKPHISASVTTIEQTRNLFEGGYGDD